MASNMLIFIISFNRLTMLRRLIDRLTEMRQERIIIIIDNHSNYKPLLDYYEGIRDSFEIIRLQENHGFRIMSKLYGNRHFRETYGLEKNNFIYTDCDVIPSAECPSDFIEKFNAILKKYDTITKVGLGIKIDDLPDSFTAKKKVMRWEAQFWEREIIDDEIGVKLYSAPIDTTFSCQRANTIPGWTESCFRVGNPYVAQHLPWYIDDNNLSDEDQHYLMTARRWETHFPNRYAMWCKR